VLAPPLLPAEATLSDENIVIAIDEKKHQLQGFYSYVSIRKLTQSEPIEGFEFKISYLTPALTLMDVGLGELTDSCNWQYLEHEDLGHVDGVGRDSGRLVKIKESAAHPDSLEQPSRLCEITGDLVTLKFYVTNDRTYSCSLLPIRFVWQDCNDNSILLKSDAEILTAKEIRDLRWFDGLPDSLMLIYGKDCESDSGFHYGGPCENCESVATNSGTQSAALLNGYVEIVNDPCFGSVMGGGDLNLNGISYGVADARILAAYLIHGIQVFDIAAQAQLALSDADGDGLPVSVADLIFLYRVRAGEATRVFADWRAYNEDVPPADLIFPWLDSTQRHWNMRETMRHGQDTVLLCVSEDEFSTDAGNKFGIGGLWAEFVVADTSSTYELVNRTELELEHERQDNKVKVLLHPGVDTSRKHIPPGEQLLFTYDSGLKLNDVHVCDSDGNLLYVIVDWSGTLMEFPPPGRK
jgi:hypothetical protein